MAAFSISDNNLFTCDGSDRSADNDTARTPLPDISAASLLVCSTDLECNNRLQPMALKAMAISLPIPLLAPVTRAHLPFISIIFSNHTRVIEVPAQSAHKADTVEVNSYACLLPTDDYHEARLDTRQIDPLQRNTVSLPFIVQYDVLYGLLARIGMCRVLA